MSAEVLQPEVAGQAEQEFLARVRRIAGVPGIEIWAGEAPEHPTMRVFVPPHDSEAADAVYRLEGEFFQRYPEARLDVWVVRHKAAPRTSDFTDGKAPG